MNISTPTRLLLALLALCAFSFAQAASPEQTLVPTDPAAKSATAEAAEPPIPTVNQLFEHLREHQKELERVRQNYIFVVDEEEQDAVKGGGYRTRTTNTYEIRYSGPWQVRTLVARDGKQLSPEDLQKNKTESDKLMHLAQQSMTRLASDPMAQGSSLNISDFLADDEFHNMRREQYQGHRVLVFDFVPRDDFKPSNAHEKFIKNMGGTIWVDENAVQLVRLEAHLLNNVSYGGFLASIKKGKILVMEQRKVNNEIWLPSFEEFHLDARAFLSGKHVNLVDHFRDYRRFRVASVFKPLEEGDPFPGETTSPIPQPQTQGAPQN